VTTAGDVPSAGADELVIAGAAGQDRAMSERVLTMVRKYPVPPERIFAGWTEPELVNQWLFGGPRSERHETEIDFRVGGKWQVADVRKGKTYTATGTYLEIEPPRRLVLTVGMPQFGPNEDTLTVELAAEGEGTVMTFTQAGTDIADELGKLVEGKRSASEMGWNYMFKGLGEVVQGRVPKLPKGHKQPS
jgi:uncharacterized protein YndB with AHSA1/START domain